MAEHFRFFNSAENDVREYLAAEFAEYFSQFLSDGLYTENGQAGLKVTPGTGLQVQVATGYAFIRGYMYKNDAVITKNLEPADTMLDRIDRVVLRFDEVTREIRVAVKKGDFSSTPTAPGLEDTSTVKELALAQVRIHRSAAGLTTANITDERLTSACGLVSSLITVPAQEMWDVWNGALSDIETAWATQTLGVANAWNQQKNQIAADWGTQTNGIDAAWGTIKSNWESWFSSMQNDLGLRVVVGETEPGDLQPGDIWIKVM